MLFAVLFCFIFAIPSTVNAESLTDILYKFSQLWPDGSYFSTTGGPCGPGQTNSYCTYCQLAVDLFEINFIKNGDFRLKDS